MPLLTAPKKHDMKRLLLFLCCLPFIASAQIAPIQTHEKPYEFISHCVYHDLNTGTYFLHAQSNNQYEDEVVRVRLGDDLTEVAESLGNLLAACSNIDQQFELGGYTFVVWSLGLQVLNRGALRYTAGEYYIAKDNIAGAIFTMVDRGAELGEVKLKADDLKKGKLLAYLKKYDITVPLGFRTDLRQVLTGRYRPDDVLSDDDICILADAIRAKTLPYSNILTRMCPRE